VLEGETSFMELDARYWSVLTRTVVISAACGLLACALLPVAKPIAALMIAVTVIVGIVGTLRAGRAYEEDRDARLAGRPRAVGWREEWRQDFEEVATDPSVELWRRHPGVALAVTVMAVGATAGMIFLRMHCAH
jgi:hypothetical protein